MVKALRRKRILDLGSVTERGRIRTVLGVDRFGDGAGFEFDSGVDAGDEDRDGHEDDHGEEGEGKDKEGG